MAGASSANSARRCSADAPAVREPILVWWTLVRCVGAARRRSGATWRSRTKRRPRYGLFRAAAPEAVGQGRTNEAIAELLVLSLKTVRNNVANICGKLQVADRAQAVIRAREAGLS